METKKRLEEGKRITFIGLLINILLTVVKLLAGSLGKSAAMLADGIHSLSDIITDVVVVAFVSVGGKESDQNHHYGHGKFETFAVMLISFTLLIVGIGISWEALKHIISHLQGSILDKPSISHCMLR